MVKVISIVMLAVVSFVTSNPERKVDCRKFVFAPMCRGVAAKRGYLPNQLKHVVEQKSLNNMLEEGSPVTSMSIIEDEDRDTMRRLIQQEKSENKKITDQLLFNLFLANRNPVYVDQTYDYTN